MYTKIEYELVARYRHRLTYYINDVKVKTVGGYGDLAEIVFKKELLTNK